MSNEAFQSPESLLALPVEEILLVVQQNISTIDLNSDVNWHCIGQVAASRAISNGSSNPAIASLWAAIAVAIYGRLAQASELKFRRLLEMDAMHVRSNMILLFGPAGGHPFLDPSDVENWFLNGIGMSLVEVSSLIAGWDSLSTRDQVALFELKQRFDVISALLSRGVFKQTNELKRWEQVLSHLPRHDDRSMDSQ